MVKVIITKDLKKAINKKFKKESIKVFELLYSLEKNPRKGKLIGQVNRMVIKELKYKSFRFYFITNGFKLKLLEVKDLTELLIKFIRMSSKKDQQKVINDIKKILRGLGEDSFN